MLFHHFLRFIAILSASPKTTGILQNFFCVSIEVWIVEIFVNGNDKFKQKHNTFV